MAEKAELVVTIGSDGVVRVKTHGLKGQTCVAETKGLEETVGKVKRREKTGEYYEGRDRARLGVKNR